MNTKNDVEVIISGKQYTLSGYESSEYLQKIATHINGKYTELKKQEAYNQLDMDMKNAFLAINLSDDYHKAQKVTEDLQKEKDELEKEIFTMKHDMIAMKAQLEEKEKEVAKLEEEKTEAEHKVIRLETELKSVTTEENNSTRSNNSKNFGKRR